ncbi:proliferating cell nuclear antigen (pcna) [Patescibacteria group bacterium]|nr:proliferating cell nuclear antigen (pcna) [Patescibacteria group bacterium]
MLMKLENPAILSRVVEIISDLVTEVRIKFNESGLSITAMDPANVSMVNFILPKKSFSVFESGEETLGINLDNLKKILKRCNPRSTLTMEKKENILNIQIYDRIKRSFNLSLIDIGTEDKEMPALEFSSRVELSSQDFLDSIEDCLVVSDVASFIIKDGNFILEAKGLNSAMSKFSEDEAKIQAENCKSRYSLEYLQKFIKASKLVDKTVLRFANDHPLRIDIKNEFMELYFLLAPRVETED